MESEQAGRHDVVRERCVLVELNDTHAASWAEQVRGVDAAQASQTRRATCMASGDDHASLVHHPVRRERAIWRGEYKQRQRRHQTNPSFRSTLLVLLGGDRSARSKSSSSVYAVDKWRRELVVDRYSGPMVVRELTIDATVTEVVGDSVGALVPREAVVGVSVALVGETVVGIPLDTAVGGIVASGDAGGVPVGV
eukprot:1047537-Pyramimonas_sp.AAC.1